MAPPQGRRPASRWALSMLVGVLVAGSVFPSSQTGSAAQADQDQVCTKLLDVFLIVDESGSIGATNYEKVRKFVSQFIESMPVGVDDVHIGLVTFSSNAVRRWALDDAKAQDPSLGSAAAMALPYAKGSTYTNKALDMVKNLLFDASKGARADVPKLVLVMTDGGSNSPSNTAASAAALRSLGAIIVVLGVGTGVNASECRNIAGCSNTTCPRYLQTDWAAVTEQVNSIILAACTDLAKDAICSEWTDYGPCKGPCGSQGLQTSTRVELSPPVPGTPPCPTCAEPQGRSCAEQPPGLERTIACVMPECKVDAQCGEFLPWSDWSATCGTATRKRVRDSYNIPPASGGGLTCLEQTPPQVESETQTVDKTPCPVQQQPGPWSDWSECSTTCGGGQQHRLREGLPQEGELYGGENLEAQGIAARETIICNENPCPVDATCGEWTPYGPCSKDCGGGTQVRRREPWLDNALHGGRTCMQQHPEGPTSMKECNSQPCPVDEVPGEWEDWQPCSEQCGLGEQLRHRGKSVQEAMYGGRTIREQNESLPDGEKILTVEIRECENHPCGPCTLPFTEWSDCPVCPGIRTRHSLVLFDYYDGKCKGITSESESCDGYCPKAPEAEAGAGGGAGGGGGGGGEEGEVGGETEEEKEEAAGFPTAAVAGGVVGGLVILAAGGGAVYGFSGGAGGGGMPEAGTEVVEEAGTTPSTEQERESLISPGEQTEMWAG